jgi:hypothetical protein
MTTVRSPRLVTQAETDQEMLGWLRDKLSEKYREGGASRHYTDAIIARFAELIENQGTFKRSLDSIADAHKLAMAQMQFAQSIVHQLEKQVHELEKIGYRNGKADAPAVELKGK